jgi:hypothetical protein
MNDTKSTGISESDIQQVLANYFPGAFKGNSKFLKAPYFRQAMDRVLDMEKNPIHLTHFNQLLHLCHEAGVSEGFFKYYFLSVPKNHPYQLSKKDNPLPQINEKGIASLSQFAWGLKRFYVDAIYCYGNIRQGYRELRNVSYDNLQIFFSTIRFPTEQMIKRGDVLPFSKIIVDDRYLIAEMACKAYAPIGSKEQSHIEAVLLDAYKKNGGGRIKISQLFAEGGVIARERPNEQMMLKFGADEFMEETVDNEDQLKTHISKIAKRFAYARNAAAQNTNLYLSIVNELDIYVATSMRHRDDFRNMARDVENIFKRPSLNKLRIRYFDPTMSAADGHEDKGLIECLMVKCAQVVLYFAGESDTFGKDAEIAMAMSLGKPVIILCPDSDRGKQRDHVFRDIHPLSRLIEFESGVAIGAMVTRSPDVAAELLERIFMNTMEYDLSHSGDGYFRILEHLTKSVVRLQTNSAILRETFWNYYHNTP